MRLTNYSDYALRTLMYLAAMPDKNELATIADIADSYQISKSHLTKVIYQLANLGYIKSVRGKHGGVRLAKPAQAINLGEVLRHTEPDFETVPCLQVDKLDRQKNLISKETNHHSKQTQTDKENECTIASMCQLKSVFYKATLAFINVMDNYTIADITQNNELLWQQLTLSSYR